MSHRTATVALQCHPSTPSPHVHGIEATFARSLEGDLMLGFHLEGDIRRLRLPAPCSPRSREGLWHHTCFEAFLGPHDAPAYWELNLSPSGEWALYRFRSYRDGFFLADETHAPSLSARTDAAHCEMQAVLSLARLSPLLTWQALRLGLTAVVEGIDGSFSYWSLRHPAGAPDFHHAEAFAARIEQERPVRPATP